MYDLSLWYNTYNYDALSCPPPSTNQRNKSSTILHRKYSALQYGWPCWGGKFPQSMYGVNGVMYYGNPDFAHPSTAIQFAKRCMQLLQVSSNTSQLHRSDLTNQRAVP